MRTADGDQVIKVLADEKATQEDVSAVVTAAVHTAIAGRRLAPEAVLTAAFNFSRDATMAEYASSGRLEDSFNEILSSLE